MKKIFALLIAVFMLSTVAFAAVDLTVDDITYDGVSDTIDYIIKVTGASAAEVGGQVYFDTNVFSFSAASDPATMTWSKNKKRVNIVGSSSDADIVITLNVLNKEAAKAGSEITLKSAKVNKNGMDLFVASGDIVTAVKAAAADPIATEYTVGEKTYTSVPNKTFTDVAVADLSNFGGNVTVTYEGGVNTYFTKAFTFGGLGTGSGTASFDVAVVGVPSNITVTDIAVAIN